MKFSLAFVRAPRRVPSRRSRVADLEPPKPAVSVPPLKFQHETLPNGLEVYSVEDHSSPTVAVQVWYHVGSKDDPDKPKRFRPSLRAHDV